MTRPEPDSIVTIQENSKWEHSKSGNIYMVVGNCFIEATCDPAIMYQRCDLDNPVIWVRPLSEWFKKFKSLHQPTNTVVDPDTLV